jgi:hypothetical protein
MFAPPYRYHQIEIILAAASQGTSMDPRQVSYAKFRPPTAPGTRGDIAPRVPVALRGLPAQRWLGIAQWQLSGFSALKQRELSPGSENGFDDIQFSACLWRCGAESLVICPANRTNQHCSAVWPGEGWALGVHGTAPRGASRLPRVTMPYIQPACGCSPYQPFSSHFLSEPRQYLPRHQQTCVHSPPPAGLSSLRSPCRLLR